MRVVRSSCGRDSESTALPLWVTVTAAPLSGAVSVPEAACAVVISPDGKIDRNRQRHRMSDTSRLNPVGVVFCFAR